MTDQLINELTGETMTLEDYIAQQRAIEKAVFRLDNTLADLKANLKATKGERDKALALLRSTVREIQILSSKRPRPTSVVK